MQRALRHRHARAQIARAVLVLLGSVALLVAGARTSPAMELLGALTSGAIASDDASRTWQGGSAPSADRAEAASRGGLTEVRIAKRAHDRTPPAAVRFARVTLPTRGATDLLRPLRVMPSSARRARALSMVLLN